MGLQAAAAWRTEYVTAWGCKPQQRGGQNMSQAWGCKPQQRGGQNMSQHGAASRSSVDDRPCLGMGHSGLDQRAGSYLIWRDGTFIYQPAESIQNRCAVYASGRTAIVNINIIDSIFPFKFPIDI